MDEIKKYGDDVVDRAPSIALSNTIIYLISMGGVKLSNILSIGVCVNATVIRETHRKTQHVVGAVPFLYLLNRVLFRMCPKTSIIMPLCMHLSEYVSNRLAEYSGLE